MAKKETTKKTEEKKTNLNEMTLKELRSELQKVSLNVASGKENNTSLIKKIKTEIARKLTQNNLKNN